jgi:TetR/AcrR family transcriptional regulator, transcriptional repressor of aconitase
MFVLLCSQRTAAGTPYQEEGSFYILKSMPKVSQEHRERRRQQILEAATECFARKGFHGTSMQDIFDASGLSAGAVYRYFPSKESLIRAIAVNVLDEVMMPAIDAVAGQRLDPADALASLAAIFKPGGLHARSLSVTVQVWAESFRDPHMAGLASDAANRICARLAQVLPADTPLEAARLIMAALQGFAIQSASLADVTPELVAAASRAFAAPSREG